MKQDIIEMARQVGLCRTQSKFDDWIDAGPSGYELEHFARLVAKAEREACAELCETGVDTEHPTVKGHIMQNFGASTHLANAIRARGEQT